VFIHRYLLPRKSPTLQIASTMTVISQTEPALNSTFVVIDYISRRGKLLPLRV
jgi:hypothetical protein